jgi:hypothetical protein
MRWFSVLRGDGSPLPVFQRVAAMPHRYSDYLPHLTIYAKNMTVEASTYCPGSVMVGQFDVINTGYPGSFVATVQAVSSPDGPPLEVFPPSVSDGDTVQVFADTTDLPPGMRVIYVNVSATIGEHTVAEMIQGYIVVTDVEGGC